MKLARELTEDLAPGVLLKRLIRSGAVELRSKNRVVPNADNWVPKATQSGIRILGEDALD